MVRGEDVRRGGDGGDGERMADVLVRVGEALDELLADAHRGSASSCRHTAVPPRR